VYLTKTRVRVQRETVRDGRHLLREAARKGRIRLVEIEDEGWCVPGDDGAPLMILVDVHCPRGDGDLFRLEIARLLARNTIETLVIDKVEPRHARWALKAIDDGRQTFAIVLGSLGDWLFVGGAEEDRRSAVAVKKLFHDLRCPRAA
jgi:hypothetical protein